MALSGITVEEAQAMIHAALERGELPAGPIENPPIFEVVPHPDGTGLICCLPGESNE